AGPGAHGERLHAISQRGPGGPTVALVVHLQGAVDQRQHRPAIGHGEGLYAVENVSPLVPRGALVNWFAVTAGAEDARRTAASVGGGGVAGSAGAGDACGPPEGYRPARPEAGQRAADRRWHAEDRQLRAGQVAGGDG